MNQLFLQKVIFINPDDDDNLAINVIKNHLCPECGKKIHVVDCWDKENLKVTYLRACFMCKLIFILSGSFENNHNFNIAKKWFNKFIYYVKTNIRRQTSEEIKKLQNIKYDLEQEIEELKELRNELSKNVNKKSLRTEYRRRTNRNVNK